MTEWSGDAVEKLEELVTTIEEEIEQDAKKAGDIIISSQFRPILNSWEDKRGQVSIMYRKVYQALMTAEDSYNKSLRSSIVKGLGPLNRNGLHYEERKAQYETKNYDKYQVYFQLKKAERSLYALRQHINDRIFWLDQRRREIINSEIRMT